MEVKVNRTMFFKMLKKEKEGKERNRQTNFDSFSSILAFLTIHQFFFCCGVHTHPPTDLDG